MSALYKYSLSGSCGKYDKNILNCFSSKGVCFKNEIGRYADVIIIIKKIYIYELMKVDDY